MTQQTPQRRPTSRRRGFTLVEVLISMGILAVAILGALQMQVLASQQNGLARRTTMAAALLRDFQETAQALPWGDPRLLPGGAACTDLAGVQFLSEDLLGNDPAPAVMLDYTAMAGSDPLASSVAMNAGALESIGGAAEYRGLARQAFRPTGQGGQALGTRGYQLGWRVTPVDTNGDGACDEARLVEVAVRVQVGQSANWRSYVGQFMQYDPTTLLTGGGFDPSRMEAW